MISSHITEHPSQHRITSTVLVIFFSTYHPPIDGISYISERNPPYTDVPMGVCFGLGFRQILFFWAVYNCSRPSILELAPLDISVSNNTHEDSLTLVIIHAGDEDSGGKHSSYSIPRGARGAKVHFWLKIIYYFHNVKTPCDGNHNAKYIFVKWCCWNFSNILIPL